MKIIHLPRNILKMDKFKKSDEPKIRLFIFTSSDVYLFELKAIFDRAQESKII